MAVHGAVLTQSRDTFQKEESIRRKLYKQLPGRRNSLIKVMLSRKGKPIINDVHTWQYDPYDAMRGNVIDVFTDVAMTVAYAGGGIVGDTVIVQLLEADVKPIQPLNQLMIYDSTLRADIMLDVQAVQIAGNAGSYATCKLLQADTAGVLAGADMTYRIAGDARAEMSMLPEGSFKEPVTMTNNAQIFMEACSMSGSEIATEDITGELPWTRNEQQALHRFNTKLLRSFLFGVAGTTYVSGRKRLLMNGLRNLMRTYAATNVVDLVVDPLFAGGTWLNAAGDILRYYLGLASKYSENGSGTVWIGDLAFNSIQEYVEDQGVYKLEPRMSDYGIEVTKLYGFGIDLDLARCTEFSMDPAFQRMFLLAPPEHMTYCPRVGRDVTYIPAGTKETQGGFEWVDGKKSGWFAHATLECDNLDSFLWLDGMGLDSLLPAP